MRFRTAFVLPVAVAGFLLVGFRLQEEHTLRFKLEPRTDNYKIEMSSNMKMNAPGTVGEQDTNVNGTMDFAVTTAAPDAAGKADVEMKTTNIELKATGMAEGMMGQDIPKTMTVKGKVDDRFRITDAKMVDVPAQAQMAMGMSGANTMTGLFFELPEKPVKVGDTWEVTMPTNPMMGDKAHPLTAKLVAIREVDGRSVYEIATTGTINIDVNMGEVLKKMAEGAPPGSGGGMMDMLAGLDIGIKGTVGVNGVALLERSNGRVVKNDMTMDVKQSMTLGGMGISADIAGKTTVKVNMK